MFTSSSVAYKSLNHAMEENKSIVQQAAEDVCLE